MLFTHDKPQVFLTSKDDTWTRVLKCYLKAYQFWWAVCMS